MKGNTAQTGLEHTTRIQGQPNLEHSDRGQRDLLRACLGNGVRARADHVGLQEGALQHHVMVRECLVAGGDHPLRGGGGHLDREVAIHQHLCAYGYDEQFRYD